jgi:heme A synthase
VSGGAPIRVDGRGRTFGIVVLVLVLLVGVGATGAVAALGDTLYPASSLAEGLRADLSPASSLLLRLRVLHPALAVAAAAVILFAMAALSIPTGDRRGALGRQAVVSLTVVQVAFGFANLLLLAPVWMQLVHLLLADLLWIAVVLAGASALAAPRRPAAG